MKFPETEQNTEELQEPIAMRTRSNTKRQSRLKEDQTTITAPSSETCRVYTIKNRSMEVSRQEHGLYASKIKRNDHKDGSGLSSYRVTSLHT
uniref:Bm3070 n=1 Tax=Brugia malayi TaxID=6279 RepID=A0A0I9N649_BRUMA|nr:Bm3070 [Brugia malayi]